ncbi:MAG TPA: polysaccharide deacetylase family protein [Bryobacteraceae bacterium]|nr:polysaccharide deacetylase family protein [Bryobacteraceae bacterium]
MQTSRLWKRCRSKCERLAVDYLFRRPLRVRPAVPIISFTFDDFPLSALATGGNILRAYGSVGTYYVSLGLSGKQDACGQMFGMSDLKTLLEQGHELGCHTFEHYDSFDTAPGAFLQSIASNQDTLQTFLPDSTFRTFSFPKSVPRAITKWKVGHRFECCRGGGQTFNAGTADLNYLRAYFIEQARGDFAAVKQIIDRNRDANGWLIFATHDVCDNPTRFGCTPGFFEAVVRYAAGSAVQVMPVLQALHTLQR